MARYKKISPGSTKWLNMNAAKEAAKTAKRAHRVEMVKALNDRKRINTAKKAQRTAEYYKTARSKSRATKISAAAAAIMESSEKTKRQVESEKTARLNAQVQYANLINGNQNKPNPDLGDGNLSNEKDNAQGWVNWN